MALGLHLDGIMRKALIFSGFLSFLAISSANAENTGTGFTNGTDDKAKGTEVVTGQESPQSGATSGVLYEAGKIEARKAKKKNHRKQPAPAPNVSDSSSSAPIPAK